MAATEEGDGRELGEEDGREHRHERAGWRFGLGGWKASGGAGDHSFCGRVQCRGRCGRRGRRESTATHVELKDGQKREGLWDAGCCKRSSIPPPHLLLQHAHLSRVSQWPRAGSIPAASVHTLTHAHHHRSLHGVGWVRSKDGQTDGRGTDDEGRAGEGWREGGCSLARSHWYQGSGPGRGSNPRSAWHTSHVPRTRTV